MSGNNKPGNNKPSIYLLRSIGHHLNYWNILCFSRMFLPFRVPGQSPFLTFWTTKLILKNYVALDNSVSVFLGYICWLEWAFTLVYHYTLHKSIKNSKGNGSWYAGELGGIRLTNASTWSSNNLRDAFFPSCPWHAQLQPETCLPEIT